MYFYVTEDYLENQMCEYADIVKTPPYNQSKMAVSVRYQSKHLTAKTPAKNKCSSNNLFGIDKLAQIEPVIF